MPEAVAGALIGGAAIIFAGLVGAIVRLMMNRNHTRSNPGELYPAAKTAVSEVRRDLRDTNQEICRFHIRLEKHMEDQNKACHEQTLILTEIKTVLENRLPVGGER